MFTDIINYQLADGVDEAQLLSAASGIIDSWMRKQPGFISWQINSTVDGKYTDIVQWKSAAAAQAAEKSMRTDIPADNPWMACYDFTSISASKLTEVAKF